ncbi:MULTISPECIES: hypothetical protein [Winogradskyella]|uniref:exodeoxyribonuclease X C-terminal domain-containing protein n=1 Tax=Winogradskyella TaxID=286104 RepID=UPI0015C8F387|nr:MULTISPECIES: hypothetical protein [Winogradskyella]QXP79206.1 hypothetical protein H0I32_00710 [Winogradskyella sp. HaHa_3_26]
MFYKLDNTLNFGKYREKTIKQIIKIDINYIVWALIEIEEFMLDDDSVLEFINNKEKITWNNNRLNNHDALSMALGFIEGDYEKERNKNITEILNKKGIKI